MAGGTDFVHGLDIIFRSGYIPIRVPAMGVIGMVATAPDADPDIFPLNRCALISNIDSALKIVGTTGSLRESLDLIKREVDAPIVVVRVEEGADDVETFKNIMGTQADKTGMYALQLAAMQVGIKPRILGIPKYDRDKSVSLALDALAEQLLAFAYKSCSHIPTISEAIKYREYFTSECGMLFWGDCLAYNDSLQMSTESLSTAQVLGKRARLDLEFGWHQSISNHVLERVEGVTNEITFDKMKPKGTEANLLNSEQISVFVKDENGFITWGNETTASTESSYKFESSTRSAHVIALTLGNLLSDMLQDDPMNRVLLEDFKEDSNKLLSAWTKEGRILGGEVILNPLKNNTHELMNGEIDWQVKFTSSIPMQKLGLEVILTSDYVMNAIGGL